MEGGGFLGTRASLTADIILVGSLLVAVLLSVGAYLAIRKQYEAHRWVQTAAVGINFILVGLMISQLLAVDAEHNVGIRPIAFVFMPAHELIGIAGFLFGGFVTLRGNNLVPQRLKFNNYKLYMRIAYGLYMAATVVGFGVYGLLYL